MPDPAIPILEIRHQAEREERERWIETERERRGENEKSWRYE